MTNKISPLSAGEKKQLLNWCNNEVSSFDWEQLRGYMAAAILAPHAIPEARVFSILLQGIEPERVKKAAQYQYRAYYVAKQQMEQRTYRLPKLSADVSADSFFDGDRQPLMQWFSGFHAGVTDFFDHWQLSVTTTIKAQSINEFLLLLGGFLFKETAEDLASRRGVSVEEFLIKTRSQLPQILWALYESAQHDASSNVLEAPSIDGRVEAMVSAPSSSDRIAIAEAILTDNSDCAEAWELLARERADNIEQMIAALEQAVAAAERTLGREFLEQHMGNLAEVGGTNVLLQSLVGLGTCYRKQGELEKAAGCFEKAMVYDQVDVFGAQAPLLSTYFELDRYDAVANILGYYDQSNPWVHFSRALLSYVRNGDVDASKWLRSKALEYNAHVVTELESADSFSRVRADYQPGSPEEAALYAEDAKGYWSKVVGAINWLRAGLA